MRGCLSVKAAFFGACGAECSVPVNVRGPPPQRYSRAKCTVPHCARTAPQSLDCVRVRSLPGPAHFASLRSAAGAVGRAVGTGARARPRGGHSATACPCGVGYAPHPHMSGIRLGRNTSHRRLPPLCGDACIPPPERAPAPFPPRVRWRAIGTCPFLRCAFAHLKVSKVFEQGRNCAENNLVLQTVGTRPHETVENGPFAGSCPQ